MSQEYLSKNPLKANGLSKRKDDGNVKPAGIEAFQSFLKALDRKSYTGMCDYAIIVLMLDTGIRTRELLNLHTSDFEAKAGCIVVSKLVAKTRKIRTIYLSASTVRLIADFRETVPLTVHFGQEEYIDGVTIDNKTFYEKLVESDVLPTTSQATPDAFIKEFEKARQAGESAVVITLASEFFGT